MNANLLVAETFVDELARGGVREVCIAPGSRSTPLTLAFSAHPAIKVYMHLDERSAAFFALGLALANQRPVPVVCTSGSAAANFFPAIVEARQSRLPLLVLTADRPHELRDSGANQTIDQVKMYGSLVLWSVDLSLPEQDPPGLALRNLRTLAARALAVADGLEKGPVHFNFPFRKPLEPAPDEPRTSLAEYGTASPFTRISTGVLFPAQSDLEDLARAVSQYERGLVVCGPHCPGGDFPQAVAALAQAAGYPLLADPLSGVRFGVPGAVGAYDTFLAGPAPAWESPQVVIRFGSVPTSAALCSYLAKITPERRILVAGHGVWEDDDHRTTWFLQADPAVTCRLLVERSAARPRSAWAQAIYQAEQESWQAIQADLSQGAWFDGAVVADVLDALPQGARLFMGNSLPIRNLDQFGSPSASQVEVFGNRGASGIDGNVSTALGLAAADRSRPLVAILGDITLYHDLNGLYALQHHGLNNVTIVLINNHGGGIFQRLPVARLDPPFTEAFLTPHNLDFEHAARMYGLSYKLAQDRQTLRDWLAAGMEASAPRLIEVQTDSRQDLQRRKEVMNFVHQSIFIRESSL